MSKVTFLGPDIVGTTYRCDLCQNLTERVLTDSYTELDICFDCASGPVNHGLFWTVTQNPVEDEGDNLLTVAKENGLIRDEDD